jgi:hypothetical protein
MARDKFHANVVQALKKDNWIITDDPLRYKSGKVNVEIDLGAEKMIGAEKEGVLIAVEVKNFLSRSPVADFEDAYGQFMLYKRIIYKNDPTRLLYLAIPEFAFKTFFSVRSFRKLLKKKISDCSCLIRQKMKLFHG